MAAAEGRVRGARPNQGDGGRSGAPVDILAWCGAGLAPAVIYLAHVFYGASLPLPALVLSATLLTVLAGHLLFSRERGNLDRLSPVWLVAGLFAATLVCAVLTLTPWLSGSLHPIWEWSGGVPSSSLNRSATTIEILKLVGLSAPFLIGCLYGARSEPGRRLYAAVMGLGGIYALVCLVMFLAGAFAMTRGQRLTGGFPSANVAGTVFGVLVMLTAAWSYRGWKMMHGRAVADRITAVAPALALLLLFLACLLLTASRGAIGATALALALFIGWAGLESRKGSWPALAMGATIIVVAILTYVQGNTLFVDRFEEVAGGSASRTDLLAPHWKAFLDAPLFGYGLGAYPEVNNQIMTSTNFATLRGTIVLHNAYVQWLEEAGIVGALPMFLLIAAILGATAWRAFTRARNRTLVVGLLLSSLIVLVHATVDVSLNTPSFCALWSLLLGLGFALSQASTRRG